MGCLFVFSKRSCLGQIFLSTSGSPRLKSTSPHSRMVSSILRRISAEKHLGTRCTCCHIVFDVLAWFTTSRVPVVDAESPLRITLFTGKVHEGRGCMFPFGCPREFLLQPSEHPPHAEPGISCSLIVTHEVHRSVAEDSISSQQDKITSSENGSTRRSGQGLS